MRKRIRQFSSKLSSESIPSRAGQTAGRLGSLALFLERSPSSVSRSCERCRKHLQQPYGMYVYYACMRIRQYETNPKGCAVEGARVVTEILARALRKDLMGTSTPPAVAPPPPLPLLLLPLRRTSRLATYSMYTMSFHKTTIALVEHRQTLTWRLSAACSVSWLLSTIHSPPCSAERRAPTASPPPALSSAALVTHNSVQVQSAGGLGRLGLDSSADRRRMADTISSCKLRNSLSSAPTLRPTLAAPSPSSKPHFMLKWSKDSPLLLLTARITRSTAFAWISGLMFVRTLFTYAVTSGCLHCQTNSELNQTCPPSSLAWHPKSLSNWRCSNKVLGYISL